ncbi:MULTISPECIES: hypothetical protein [Nocardiopsis]|uniref:Uncharacterized protein n=1 Tax=Nocardiopsis sinuspersici TaxID=501010 RepID=A0A1V3C5Y3_9ACTN|nr:MULTISPECIES: hypothetical protein [Nocardiopsis]OOC56058.1 hypothetical protein NOSIN_21325 [Nocardiopsis sinuspersici]
MSTPLPWGAPEPDLPTGLYDSLSEALRSRPRHAGEAHTALREADRLLSLLDTHLRAGGLPPEPWRFAGHDRGEQRLRVSGSERT